jgi:hypothetical protein
MDSRLSPAQTVGIIVAACIIIPLAWLIWEPGVFGKVWIVVKHNPAFWIVGLVAAAFGLYRKISYPLEFAWVELLVQIPTSSLAVLSMFSLFFYTSTNMSDSEIWNGYVTTSEYYEAWTEEVTDTECTGTDSNGNCTGTREVKRNVYHPPEWYIHTTNDEKIGISKSVYRGYVSYFGNERKENLFHMNQVSIGDGNRFYTTYSGGANQPIWSAREHPFVNYLKASQSIKLRQGSAASYAGLLLSYPQVYSGSFGPIELDRVLSAGTSVPSDWAQSVDHGLDRALGTLGNEKQVNLLMYVVGTSNRAFLHALEEHWVFGKKNDVIVVIGAKTFPKIDWVDVMAWTDVEEFKIILRNRILELHDLSDSDKLVGTIVSQVSLSPEKGGFKRKPMAELEYLVSDISLPWWASVLVILFSGLLSWGTSWALINNEFRS